MAWNGKETLATIARSRFIPAVLVGCVILLWLRYTPATSRWSPQNVIGMVMPESKAISHVVKMEVPGPETIRVVPKPVIVEKWHDLPTPATVANENACVLAVADIPPSPGGGTAISVLTTGPDNVAVGTIEYKPKAAPFFQVKKELGLRAGMGTGGLVLGEVYVHPVRVGPVDVELRGFGKRDDRSGADFGGVALIDMRF